MGSGRDWKPAADWKVETLDGEASFPMASAGELGAEERQALDELAKDDVVKSAMPGKLYEIFNHYKRDEWERHLASVTDWERDEYLEYLP
jgi:glutamine synthetase